MQVRHRDVVGGKKLGEFDARPLAEQEARTAELRREEERKSAKAKLTEAKAKVTALQAQLDLTDRIIAALAAQIQAWADLERDNPTRASEVQAVISESTSNSTGDDEWAGMARRARYLELRATARNRGLTDPPPAVEKQLAEQKAQRTDLELDLTAAFRNLLLLERRVEKLKAEPVDKTRQVKIDDVQSRHEEAETGVGAVTPVPPAASDGAADDDARHVDTRARESPQQATLEQVRAGLAGLYAPPPTPGPPEPPPPDADGARTSRGRHWFSR